MTTGQTLFIVGVLSGYVLVFGSLYRSSMRAEWKSRRRKSDRGVRR